MLSCLLCMSNYSQVHDRDLDTDFCLLVVKKLLRTNSRHVKVSIYGKITQDLHCIVLRSYSCLLLLKTRFLRTTSV